MFKQFPLIINIFKSLKVKENKLVISGLAFFKGVNISNFDVQKLKIQIGENTYNIKLLLKKGIPFLKGFKINYYKFELPFEEAVLLDIQNKLIVNYNNDFYGRIIYNVLDLKKGYYKNSRIIKYDDKSFYLRQTIKNTMYLTVRETNKYDYPKGQFKLFVGWLLSKLIIKKRFVLLYEKECSRFEESAAVLYKKLINEGYKNVYYIINQDNYAIGKMPQELKKNLIYKDTLKHIVYFFKCKNFISSESLDHCLQLRIANKKAMKKIHSKRLKYVFLQHGVMYMISLSSSMRSGFRKQDFALHKIVVSSDLEADHFIKMAGFKRRDLYKCGLIKLDEATRNPKADRIVIMPTWRRWEVNTASTDFENTKYFQMIKRIINGIPKEFHNDIIILPHPLMANAIKDNKKYQKYLIEDGISYDDVLKECSVLITDYSSISYDAFYRGSNIIFYWEEKKECLKNYGPDAKLLLNKTNVFGDVAMNANELSKVFLDNYKKPQNPNYIKRYRKIVEFHDNKNASRLIKMLKKDKMI